jgi:hypothetical protein
MHDGREYPSLIKIDDPVLSKVASLGKSLNPVPFEDSNVHVIPSLYHKYSGIIRADEFL